MDLHERQQFDFLLQVAVERYVERLEQVGPARAKLEGFVEALFNDFLLDNADGACFVLSALAANDGQLEQTLIAIAKSSFSHLMQRKVEEGMEMRSVS